VLREQRGIQMISLSEEKVPRRVLVQPMTGQSIAIMNSWLRMQTELTLMWQIFDQSE
jgi:hypothetical protein